MLTSIENGEVYGPEPLGLSLEKQRDEAAASVAEVVTEESTNAQQGSNVSDYRR